jgi:hypothetical protein
LLHCAIQHAGTEILQLLLDHGADPNEIQSKDESPLYLCVKLNDLASAKRLISWGADRFVLVKGHSLLYYVATFKNLPFAEFLYDECHLFTRTTSVIATSIQTELFGMISYFLLHGCNPNFLFHLHGELMSLLDLCIFRNNMQCFSLFLSCGADPQLVVSPLVTTAVRERLKSFSELQTTRQLPEIDQNLLPPIWEDLSTLKSVMADVLVALKEDNIADFMESISCLRMCCSSFAAMFRDANRLAMPIIEARDEALAALFNELALEDAVTLNRSEIEDSAQWSELCDQLFQDCTSQKLDTN